MQRDQHRGRQGICGMEEKMKKPARPGESSGATKYLKKYSTGPETNRCRCGGILVRNGYCFTCLACGEGGCG